MLMMLGGRRGWSCITFCPEQYFLQFGLDGAVPSALGVWVKIYRF